MTPELNAVLRLQARARQAESREVLGFVMVNETRGLVPYRQAVFWNAEGRPTALSGVAAPEPTAPFTQWLERLFRSLSKAPSGPVKAEAVGPRLGADWGLWLPAEAVWLPFEEEEGGGLLYARDEPWNEDELGMLEGLAAVYNTAWQRVGRRKPRPGRGRGWKRPMTRAALGIAVLGIAALPVPLTVLAPAEIVAAYPEVIRVPLDGVVARMHVNPNDHVVISQPLFDLDDVTLRSKLDVAEKAQASARAEYEQASQRGLYDAAAKARLVPLAGLVEERGAEVTYIKKLLERVRVAAPREGVAVLDDPNEWIGRPVTVGERVMAIAGERDTEVEAWLAVADVVELETGAPVAVFLNAAPLAPIGAKLRYMAFQAQQRPDGTQAYRVRAAFDDIAERPRLGLKGTARITAGRASVAYWLLRRPLAAIRQSLGL